MGTTVACFSAPGGTSSPGVKLSPCRVTGLMSTTSAMTSTTSATSTTTIRQTTNSKNTKLQLRDSSISFVGNITMVLFISKGIIESLKLSVKQDSIKSWLHENLVLSIIFGFLSIKTKEKVVMSRVIKHTIQVRKLNIKSTKFSLIGSFIKSNYGCEWHITVPGNVYYRLSTISLMATRSLLSIVTARSVCILLECFLVLQLKSFNFFSTNY